MTCICLDLAPNSCEDDSVIIYHSVLFCSSHDGTGDSSAAVEISHKQRMLLKFDTPTRGKRRGISYDTVYTDLDSDNYLV